MKKSMDLLIKKTLDFSLRNPLINFHFYRKSNVEFILDDLNEVYHGLNDKKGFIVNVLSSKIVKSNHEDKTELYSRINNLFLKQKFSVKEYGINPIFTVFGLLKYFDKKSDSEIYAPLLMVPTTIKKSGKKGFALMHEYNEIQLNQILLEKLKKDGIKVNVFDFLDHGAFNVHDYLDALNHEFKDVEGFEVIDKCFLSVFFVSSLTIYRDLVNNKNKLIHNDLVSSVLGKEHRIINKRFIKRSDLDLATTEEENYSILWSDSSQEAAMFSSSDNSSFVLFGPPGTGKSQTITNMIAQNLAYGKKILFVSEKRAALEVVYEKLVNNRLGKFVLDLHRQQINKEDFVGDMFDCFNESVDYEEKVFETFGEIQKLKGDLQEYYQGFYKENSVLGLSLNEVNYELTKLDYLEPLDFHFNRIYEVSKKMFEKLIDYFKVDEKFDEVLKLFRNDCIHSLDVLSSLKEKIINLLNSDGKNGNYTSVIKEYNEVFKDEFNLVVASNAISALMIVEMDYNRYLNSFNKDIDFISKTDLKKLERQHREIKGVDFENRLFKTFLIEWKNYLEFNLINNYSSSEIEEKIVLLEELEKKKLKENPSRIISKIYQDFIDENDLFLDFLDNQIAKTRNKSSVRQIISEYYQSILKIKPIWVMSPTTVSGYLPDVEGMFDMVIFDEASQVLTQNALGAIFRAKQVIICGDHEQLPPTTFFSQSYEDEDDDFEDVGDYESILDISRASLSSYKLNWHYRSKDAKLIEYSNKKIYKDLVAIPNPSSVPTGLIYHYLTNGVYYEQTNIVEAKFIAKKVIEHAKEKPEFSLGVIAFSKKQASLIKREVDKLVKKEKLEEFFDEDKEEAFFVKNLENVQGDERDYVFLSVCYASDEFGKLSLNFGPINKLFGYRRLNVAITRAKYKLNIVSSILPDELGKSKNEGVIFLKEFLELVYNNSFDVKEDVVMDPRNYKDYLIQIRKELLMLGYKAKISEQLFDSITVENDKNSICLFVDSSSYVDIPTVKERDIHVKNVIEDKGWTFKKVYLKDVVENFESFIRDFDKVVGFKPVIKEEKVVCKEVYPKVSVDINFDLNNRTFNVKEVEEIKEDKPQYEAILDPILKPDVLKREEKVQKVNLTSVSTKTISRSDDETLIEYLLRVTLLILEKEEQIPVDDLYDRLATAFEMDVCGTIEKQRINDDLEIWEKQGKLTFDKETKIVRK